MTEKRESDSKWRVRLGSVDANYYPSYMHQSPVADDELTTFLIKTKKNKFVSSKCSYRCIRLKVGNDSKMMEITVEKVKNDVQELPKKTSKQKEHFQHDYDRRRSSYSCISSTQRPRKK